MQAHSLATGMGAQAGAEAAANSAESNENLIGIDEVQRSLNRSRASVYRYTNTDPRNLNPPFNPRKLNPEYRSDQKEPLMFHPNEVARFARDVLRIKEVTVEVLNSPSTATQQLLGAILEELRLIRGLLNDGQGNTTDLDSRRELNDQARPLSKEVPCWWASFDDRLERKVGSILIRPLPFALAWIATLLPEARPKARSTVTARSAVMGPTDQEAFFTPPPRCWGSPSASAPW